MAGTRPLANCPSLGNAPVLSRLLDRIMTASQKTLIYVATEDWYVWAHRLAVGQGALAAGYRVIVACRVQAQGQRLADSGFEVVALPWRRRGGTLGGEFRTLILLWRLFRRERPAIVHCWALKPILYGGLMARLARVPVRIATVAGLGYVFTSARLKARLLRPVVTLALGWAMGGTGSWVALENREDGRVLARAGALRPAQIGLVCSCGVDTDRFRPAPAPDGVPVVAMASRLLRDKGAAVLVEAVLRLRAAGVEFRLRLAGGVDPESPDSHTEDEIRAWVAEGLVDWSGHVEDIVGFWQASHIAAYPSRYGEGVPKTLMEAAACGRPIVTTDRPGCRETVSEGVNGFLVPVDDPAALAERLERLIRDPALRLAMGEASRVKALAEFAEAHVVAATLALYRTALASACRETVR
jgi:glycosyltransferase involved in cell wall biosynthesis